MDNYNLQQTDAKIQAILNKVQPVVDNNTVAGFGNGYAISTTAGATADKEVTINGFTPTIGGVFSVMFQNAFSASDPTLNVSNTGAKDLMLFGSALPAAFVPAGTILTLTYDGTNYNVIGRLTDITVKSTLESTDSPLLQDANGNFIKSTPAALASLLGVDISVFKVVHSTDSIETIFPTLNTGCIYAVMGSQKAYLGYKYVTGYGSMIEFEYGAAHSLHCLTWRDGTMTTKDFVYAT